MPKATYKGKTKNFPYTKAGKAAAKRYKGMGGRKGKK